MKRFLGILLIWIIVLTGFIGCATAEFEVSSITVTPSPVVAGESVVAEANVSNIGGAEGVYTANITVDGKLMDTSNIVVASGATEKVSFTYCMEDAGIHTIELCGKTTTVTALKPAEFKIGSLSITPEEVTAGQEATVTIDVSNIGEVEGTYNATLNVNGAESQIEKVKLAGGKTQTVGFTLMNEISGSYNIEIGGMTGTLRVLRPAEFEVVSLNVPSKAVVGESVVATADIINVGEVEGNYSGNLSFNDSEMFTSFVTVAPEQTKTIYFECTGLTSGIKTVKLSGKSSTLHVLNPVDIANYAWLKSTELNSCQTESYITTRLSENKGGDVIYEVFMGMDFDYDMDNKQIKLIMSIKGKEMGQQTAEMEIQMYITDDKLYMRMYAPGEPDEWIYTELTPVLWVSMQQYMVIQSQLGVVENAEVNFDAIEEINGVECYVFEIIPSKEDFLATMLTQQMLSDEPMDLMTTQSLIDTMEMTMTQWVTRETHIPVKTLMYMGIDMSEFGEGYMTMDIESHIWDYNQPFIVELPEEAKQAKYMGE